MVIFGVMEGRGRVCGLATSDWQEQIASLLAEVMLLPPPPSPLPSGMTFQDWYSVTPGVTPGKTLLQE